MLHITTSIAPAQTLSQMQATSKRSITWLWGGYIARGAVTLLTSRWKAGKTTLLAALLAKLERGGEFAGSTVRPACAVVVTEESSAIWLKRNQALAIGSHVSFICRPFFGKPTMEQWSELVMVLAKGLRHKTAIVVIDLLASFLPGNDENNASSILNALPELHKFTKHGVAVLLLHHPTKKTGTPRGSGALTGFADILLELDWPANARVDDRRRWLRGQSRFSETPAERLIELSADCRDYTVCDAAASEFEVGWPVLRMVLEDAASPLTRRDVIQQWPPDYDRPDNVTVWRWLSQAVVSGAFERTGAGRRSDPFRYWLAGREKKLVLPELEPVKLPWENS